MEDKYEKMTDEDFDTILKIIVENMTGDQILAYGDVNAVLREELNNEVLTAWENGQDAVNLQKERETVVCGGPIDWFNVKGNCQDIENVPGPTFKKLLELDIINPNDQGHESAPEYGELADAVDVAPDKITLSGDIHPDRVDFTSIDCKGLTPKEMQDLIWLIHWATDYSFDFQEGTLSAAWF